MAKQFSIVPSEAELAAIGRDLKFHPCQNSNPRLLSADQIRGYNQDGYVAPLEIYTAQEIAGIRAYFDDLLARVVQQGGDSYSISSAHLKYAPVYDILTHPKTVALVSDLLGEHVIGWGSHFFCKMPRDGKAVAWHQDASYWPLSPSKAVTVWLAIDDADPENACMQFVAGSHHHGHMTYRPSSPDEHNVLNQTIDDPQAFGRIVDDSLRAGQASLHSDLLLHGSQANASDRRRCGLTLRYRASSAPSSRASAAATRTPRCTGSPPPSRRARIPRYLARRLVVSASEDVGNAEPRGLPLAIAALDAVEKIGAETNDEGLYALAQATVFLAGAAKDPSAGRGFFAARETVRAEGTRPVPSHLRPAAKTYRNPHDDPAGAALQRYLPRGLEGRRFLGNPEGRPGDEG